MELGHKHTIDELVGKESGQNAIGCLLGVAAMPLCAIAGSYLGEGLGYLWGNLIDIIPYVNQVAPWMAERAGLINDVRSATNLNEDLYQTAGAISGFWGGLWLPLRIALANKSE